MENRARYFCLDCTKGYAVAKGTFASEYVRGTGQLRKMVVYMDMGLQK